MPNVHRPDCEPISIQIPRQLMVRAKKAARKRGKTLTEYLSMLLHEDAKDEPLTSDDYFRIAEATRLAEQSGKRVATKVHSK
jgi:hypothetical protein